MKTVDDLFWLVAVIGLVMVAQWMVAAACLWHITKLMASVAANIATTAEWAREEEDQEETESKATSE